MKNITKALLFSAVTGIMFACGSSDPVQEVNVYTHRHYEADGKLYEKFTEETGIKVNVVNANADELIQRLETEGANSPADILITVDGGRLNRAQEKGLLQPVKSPTLEANVPAQFREPNGHWYGVTYRARIIAYSKDRVKAGEIKNYEDLQDPKWKGRILVRSSEHIYNQSLLASILLSEGEDKALEWAKGIVANLARNPKGSDRDQVKAVASGEGDLAIVNTYYIGLMLNSESAEEKKAAESIQIVYPNQDNRGTHINVSAVAVTKHSPNRENAIKFLEFMSGNHAQEILAQTNFEYPVNPEVPMAGLLESWGTFKKDSVNLSLLGKYNDQAVKLMDQAGWK
jgi:iron(III) transport system substrate-binding protein